MKKRFRVAALAGTVSLGMLLAACGGGGGGGAPVATPAPAPQAPATTQPPAAITLTSVTAPPLTAADCARLQSDSLSQAALNLSNPQIAQLNQLLQQIDPEFAWKMFVRAPEKFINWAVGSNGGVLDAIAVGAAAHEVHHEIGFTLTQQCAPVGNYKLHWAGTTYVTNLVAGSTPTYGIVDTVLPNALKGSTRYQDYIIQLGNVPGNRFNMLFDELAAYVGDAIANRAWLAERGDQLGAVNAGLAGTIEFMAWTQAYLNAVRTTNPTAWNSINNDQQLKAALQAVWTRAEQIIEQSYPLTLNTATTRLVYDPAVFSYVYSAGPLNELTLLGINARSRASWVGTYL